MPLLGYLGDKYGQTLMASLGGATLIPGYAIAAWVYNVQGSYKALAFSWAIIGCGTSCLFFCGLVTCARLYPNVTGLAISAPVAAFGLSSLWESQIVRAVFSNNGEVNVTASFWFFALLYVFGCGSGIGAAKLAKVEPKDDTKQDDEGEEDENQGDGELSQKDRLYKFLSSPEAWLFFLVFVVTIGPLEMYVVNMGAIIDTIPEGPEVSFHVALFSAASTVARLCIGILSDLMKKYVSRPIQLASNFILTAFCHFLLANGVLSENSGRLFFISSLANGFAYGITFTLVPTVVACVWGVKSFGTNWGMFILAPAIGSTIYGLLFASLYEKAARSVMEPLLDTCAKGYLCYSWTFTLTGCGMLLAGAVTTGLWTVRWKDTVSSL